MIDVVHDNNDDGCQMRALGSCSCFGSLSLAVIGLYTVSWAPLCAFSYVGPKDHICALCVHLCINVIAGKRVI